MPTAWHGATAYPGQRRFLKYVALTGSDDEGPTLAEVLYKEHPSQPISISRLEGPTLKRRAFFLLLGNSWYSPLWECSMCRCCETLSSRHGMAIALWDSQMCDYPWETDTRLGQSRRREGLLRACRSPGLIVDGC